MPSTRSLIHRSKLCSVATLLVVLASGVSVAAHSTFAIEGLVTDQKGEIAPAVVISLMGEGFQTQILHNLQSELWQRIIQDFQLKIGDVSERVTVTFSTPPVRGGDSFAISTAGNQFLPNVYH